jgi:adenosylhomocysteinase
MRQKIKNIKLADQGKRNIEWAERQMGALLKIRQRFHKEKPLKGRRIGMALHITKETAVLVNTLIAGGADVAITSCNPLSTQDDVAAALAFDGIEVYGFKGESVDDYYRFIKAVLDFKPDITIDDGCDLVTAVHLDRKKLIDDMICGCEETTTGIIRLMSMDKEGALLYPIIAVNESDTKHLMDNYYGTGQSTIDGILRASNILFAGKTVVVLGYGNCGKGVSLRAKGMGANVIISEVNPFRALQAVMDGYRIMKLSDALQIGDVFITVTGNLHVISVNHIKKMKNGAILANAGHFNNEIDVDGLEKAASSKRTIRPYFDEYRINKISVYVCGEGRLVNLACAEGHPSTVMSLSFCNQALGVEYGINNRGKLKPGVHTLPKELDMHVAELQLEAMGISIDTLTPRQRNYLNSWKEGT